MTVQFRSRIPSVIDYATEIKSVGVCCFLQDGTINKVQSTQIECYALKGNFQFGNINDISCDTVAETGCCCSCSEASKHEDYEAFLDAATPVDDNCTSGPADPNAWGDGIGLKSNITKCQCDKVGGKWTAGDCPVIFHIDVLHKDGVRSRCYTVKDPIIPVVYKYYCTPSGLCGSCVESQCDMTSGIVYYDTQDACDLACLDPLRWQCLDGTCYSGNDLTLPFASQAECESRCPRYSCNPGTGLCTPTYTDPTGIDGSYSNMVSCMAICQRDGICCHSSSTCPENNTCTISKERDCFQLPPQGNCIDNFTFIPSTEYTSCTQLYASDPTNACVDTPLGVCCGYGETDPTDIANCKFITEWDCTENGGRVWTPATSIAQCNTSCAGLVEEWYCKDGDCISGYFTPGTHYPKYNTCIAAATCPRYICVNGSVISIVSTDSRWSTAYRTFTAAIASCDPTRGTCCSPDGSCTNTTEGNCPAPSSWTAVLDGSTICTPNLCTQPTGSCCYINPSTGDRICATGISETACKAFGDPDYIFKPLSSVCLNCDPFVGKCCRSYECTDGETRTRCQSTLGTWTKFGTCSEPTPCGTNPNPEGRCCIDGVCGRYTQSLCLTLGGVWENTPDSCSPNPCITPTQRCCYSNGTCTDSTVQDCLNAGGASSGAGTSCSNGTCESAITCCTGCKQTLETATSCSAGGGFTISNPTEPCCVQCCYNQSTTANCEYLTSNALESATTRCLGLGGTIIDQSACSSCILWKYGCVNGTCTRTSNGIYTTIEECNINCLTGSCCKANGTCTNGLTKIQCGSDIHTIGAICDATCVGDPIGGCCEFGANCRPELKSNCSGNWSPIPCQSPPEYCGDDVIIVDPPEPCLGDPTVSIDAICNFIPRILTCDCCSTMVDLDVCLAACANAEGCIYVSGGGGSGGGGPQPLVAQCEIDVRIPRSCCYIQYDPTFGAIGMTCNNVCSSAECEKLKVISNSQHPAVYTADAICPPRQLSQSGSIFNCNGAVPLTMSSKSFYSGVPFGMCWTLGVTAQYSCNITDESACTSSNGYWISLQTSDGEMCNSTYRPQPINITTTRILEPETMNASEFESLGLEFGDFYKGGYYIGIYSPGVPLTQSGSSLYGSLNFTMPKVNPSTAIGRGETSVTKWALIVEQYTYKASFLNTTESPILLPHTKLSKYDGFYNCYGDGVFGGLRSSLTNSVVGRNRRGFPDYYLPSIQELMFLAYQINDFSTDNYIKYISIFKNDQGISKPTYLSSSSINDNLLYSQYLQPMDTDSFGRIFTSKLNSINTVKFFRRINLT
jgi:hypothetical protein